jgi:hypothetical protein
VARGTDTQDSRRNTGDFAVTNAEKTKVHDLRNDKPARTDNPKVGKEQLNGVQPLVEVDQPHLATPGTGGVPSGQTTHE